MVTKTKKSKKKVSGRHGHGASWRGSGRHGGCGMAGTGKKADHKKSLVLKKYDKYFGKAGFTSRPTKRIANQVMNLEYIQTNIESLKKKYLNKEGVLEVKDYKILGRGEIKEKITIKAAAVSASAKQKIEAAGGKVIVPEIKERPKIKSAKKGDKKPEEQAEEDEEKKESEGESQENKEKEEIEEQAEEA